MLYGVLFFRVDSQPLEAITYKWQNRTWSVKVSSEARAPHFNIIGVRHSTMEGRFNNGAEAYKKANQGPKYNSGVLLPFRKLFQGHTINIIRTKRRFLFDEGN